MTGMTGMIYTGCSSVKRALLPRPKSRPLIGEADRLIGTTGSLRPTDSNNQGNERLLDPHGVKMDYDHEGKNTQLGRIATLMGEIATERHGQTITAKLPCR